MADQFTNNAASTLASGISNSATSLTVATGEGALFPQPGDGFWATLEEGTTREIVRVTARSTDTFTVTRGQQGTSGTTFNAGAKVELRLTKSSVDAYETHIVAVAPHSGYPTFDQHDGRRFVTGLYYGSQAHAFGAGNNSSGETRAVPFQVSRSTTFDRIGINVTTGTASSVCRLGIYNSSGGKPSSVLLAAGTIDASTIGFKEITISQVLTPGLYFLVILVEGATAVITRTQGPELFNMPQNSTGHEGTTAWFKGSVSTGSLPDPFPTDATRTSNGAHVLLRVQ